MAENKFAGLTTLSAFLDNLKTLFATKADLNESVESVKSNIIHITLSANDWADGAQTISISGLGATQNGSIDIANSATMDQHTEARNARMTITAQDAGSLTIKANGVVPTIDIPVTITMIG